MRHIHRLMSYKERLAVGGLALLTAAMLACGGGDAATPAPTPAPTEAPAAAATAIATAAPAGGGATPAATAEPAPADQTAALESSTGSESLFLSANETGTIKIDLQAGDLLQLTFDVESNIVGGQNVSAGIGKATEGVQVVIRDHLETPLLTIDETTDSDTVEVQAELTGTHEALFFNPFPLQAESVHVDWVVNP